MIASCLDSRIEATPIAHKLISLERNICTTASHRFADKNKLDDFRAREEEKEAEFNKQPIEQETSDQQQSSEEDEQVKQTRNKILEASLEFVISEGWTRQAIVKGAEKAGYPGAIQGMFSDGGIELVNYYYLKCNNELIELMSEKAGIKSEHVENPKEFVSWALQQRLIMVHPYIKQWPQALAMMTLPQNVPVSLANMLTLVDDICYFSGDRSVDVSYFLLQLCDQKIFLLFLVQLVC